tara:strand:+ start:425 stop:1021 length:597 start_codon:yes stop_codon:yes gene_type:complete
MRQNENSLIKSFLEFGPLLVFFISYKYAPIGENFVDNPDLGKIIFATKLFIPVILGSLIIGWVVTREISKMPLFTAAVVLVFGGLTIWLQNDTFIKMKPSIIYVTFAGILAFGLFKRKSYLKTLLGSALPMRDEGWILLTKRFMILFFVLASLNEVIWRTMSTDQWITFKTFVIPGATFLFLFLQYGIFRDYLIDKGE